MVEDMSDLLSLPRDFGGTLRHLELDDAGELLAAVESDRPRLEAWLHWPRRVVDLAGSRRLIDDYRRRVDGRWAGLGVFIAQRLVGGTNLLRWMPEHDQIELGVWATRQAEGRGLMRAACAATIRYARAELRIQRVEWRAGVENTRSRALAVRLGFVEEGVARSAEAIDGRRLDVVCFSLVETELDAF
jgi:ribosomal-protein-serine acetyltransferase